MQTDPVLLPYREDFDLLKDQLELVKRQSERFEDQLYRARVENEKIYSRLRNACAMVLQKEGAEEELTKRLLRCRVDLELLRAARGSTKASELLMRVQDRIRTLEGHTCIVYVPLHTCND